MYAGCTAGLKKERFGNRALNAHKSFRTMLLTGSWSHLVSRYAGPDLRSRTGGFFFFLFFLYVGIVYVADLVVPITMGPMWRCSLSALHVAERVASYLHPYPSSSPRYMYTVKCETNMCRNPSAHSWHFLQWLRLNKWRWDKNANIPKNTHERVVWTDIATTIIKCTYKQIRTRETIKWDTKDRDVIETNVWTGNQKRRAKTCLYVHLILVVAMSVQTTRSWVFFGILVVGMWKRSMEASIHEVDCIASWACYISLWCWLFLA